MNTNENKEIEKLQDPEPFIRGENWEFLSPCEQLFELAYHYIPQHEKHILAKAQVEYTRLHENQHYTL